MQKLSDNLYVGSQDDCKIGHCMKPKHAVVHCVKDPCHSRVARTRKLDKQHANYLAFEFPGDLYLNMIDPDKPLFQPGTFERFMDFMRRHRDDEQVLIHCNQGHSRAPSLAMLWLAKGLHEIPDESYDVARDSFEKKFPEMMNTEGKGIETYMREHWNEI